MPDDMTGYEAAELTQIEAIIAGGGSDTAQDMYKALLPFAERAIAAIVAKHAAAGGGGSQPVTGFFVRTESGGVPNYDQDKIQFKVVDSGDVTIGYDPDGFWDAGAKQATVPTGKGGLYIVSSIIELNGAGSFDNPPEFEIAISSTPWNYDPLIFGLPQRFAANHYVGSVSQPIRLSEGCVLFVDGFWGGAATADLGDCAFSCFKLGDLA